MEEAVSEGMEIGSRQVDGRKKPEGWTEGSEGIV